MKAMPGDGNSTMSVGGLQWLNLFIFDTTTHLDAWLHSEVRANRLAAATGLFDEQVKRQQMVGIGFWFDDEDQPKSVPPPKWKMAVITGVIILVLLNSLIAWFSAGLDRLGIPRWIIGICSVALLISLMTWAIMPWVTRVLRKWLVA